MRFVRPRPLLTRPRVSVVVPCYNYARYLPQAVASALDQPGLDVEVIVVDDASRDDSALVATRLAATHPEVSVVRHRTNAGHIATYNDGLARTTGDYVVLLSADDVLTPGSLTRSVALMEALPSVGLVYGYARSFDGTPPPPGRPVRSWSLYPGRQWLRIAARKGRCFISCPEAVLRRRALDDAGGGYEPALPHSADFYLWLLTASRWDVGRVNGPVQAGYRVHDHNMHLTTYAGWATDLRERRRTFELLAEQAPGLAAERDRALRALSREATQRALHAARSGDDAAVIPLLDLAADLRPERGLRLVDRVATTPPVARVTHHLQWRWERRYGT